MHAWYSTGTCTLFAVTSTYHHPSWWFHFPPSHTRHERNCPGPAWPYLPPRTATRGNSYTLPTSSAYSLLSSQFGDRNSNSHLQICLGWQQSPHHCCHCRSWRLALCAWTALSKPCRMTNRVGRHLTSYFTASGHKGPFSQPHILSKMLQKWMTGNNYSTTYMHCYFTF